MDGVVEWWVGVDVGVGWLASVGWLPRCQRCKANQWPAPLLVKFHSMLYRPPSTNHHIGAIISIVRVMIVDVMSRIKIK